MGEAPITQDALNRMEATARRELDAHKELDEQRFREHERRLGDLNNSHEKATLEKQRTDDAALRVQENAVTRAEFQAFKEEQIRLTSTEVGMAKKEAEAHAQRATNAARIWSIGTAVLVIVINLVIRHFTPTLRTGP